MCIYTQVVSHISEQHKLPSIAKNTLEPGSSQEELFKKMSHSNRCLIILYGYIIACLQFSNCTGKSYTPLASHLQ